MKGLNGKIALAFLLLSVSAGTSLGAAAEKGHEGHGSAAEEFTVIAIDYQGTKIWTPATLIVKKGQSVRIKLINNMPSEPNIHGYAIDAFKVKAVVARGEPKTVEFKADKDGLFTIYCQLHPAHIGGQLLVLP